VSVGGALVSGTSWQIAQVVLYSAAMSSGAVALALAVPDQPNGSSSNAARILRPVPAVIETTIGVNMRMPVISGLSVPWTGCINWPPPAL
jgi:hypothetical protein